MQAFQKTLTKQEHIDILSQRRDSCLMSAAKIVSTFGTILIYRWLMGDKVTEGARNEKFITAKYKKLLQSTMQDSIKMQDEVNADGANTPRINGAG